MRSMPWCPPRSGPRGRPGGPPDRRRISPETCWTRLFRSDSNTILQLLGGSRLASRMKKWWRLGEPESKLLKAKKPREKLGKTKRLCASLRKSLPLDFRERPDECKASQLPLRSLGQTWTFGLFSAWKDKNEMMSHNRTKIDLKRF